MALTLAADYQGVTNPACNADRRPVHVFCGRLHGSSERRLGLIRFPTTNGSAHVRKYRLSGHRSTSRNRRDLLKRTFGRLDLPVKSLTVGYLIEVGNEAARVRRISRWLDGGVA